MFARGNRRQLIFQDDADYELYLRLLAGIVLAKKWRLLAYCLMPNHVHLVIETPEANLARGMQHLHGLYARMYNDRHALVGHLFQGRYGSKLVHDDRQFAAVIRYVALNPVEASLCPEPLGWRWSSVVSAVRGAVPAWLDIDRLLGYLGLDGRDPLNGYARLVSAGLPGLS